jgi:hypothetical protein
LSEGKDKRSGKFVGIWLIVAIIAFVAFAGYIAFPKGAGCRGTRPTSQRAAGNAAPALALAPRAGYR